MISHEARFRNSRKKHGTPLFVVDHDELRKNYAAVRKHLPRVQAYYAVKANSDPAIVQDVLRSRRELRRRVDGRVPARPREHQDLPAKQRQDFIWDKIIYANPDQGHRHARASSNPYKPLVTYDNHDEIHKIKKHAPHAGLVLRLSVPNTGAMVELSSKFGALPGEAVDLIAAAFDAGSSSKASASTSAARRTNFANYVQALNLAGEHLRGSR